MSNEIQQYLKKHGFEAWCPKAVLFDMDGVLYDSMPLHAVAWQQSMAHYGIAMTHADAYATEGQRGVDTIRQMVKRQRGADISMEQAQEMYDLKSKLFHEMPAPPVMPGVKELMAKMHAAGLTICVVTGSGQKPLIRRILSDFGEFICREHIVTAYDVERGKPLPDPYLMGLQKAGKLKPWEAIVVENAPLGVRAGVAAQILTIAVNTSHLPQGVLEQACPDIVADDMPTLCSRWNALGIRCPS